MKKRYDYDVAIVGAGPAGIFSALRASANKKLRILIVDKGKRINKRTCPSITKKVNCTRCRPCDILCGWGGAGAFSDGKLNLSSSIGGQITSFINKDRVEKLIKEADDLYLKFGGPREIYGTDEDRVHELSRKATAAGLTLIPSELRHLGTENCIDILKGMEEYLKDKIDMSMNTNVKGLLVEEDKIIGIQLEGGRKIRSRYVVAAPGREGADWLAFEAKRLGLKTVVNPVDVGVRVEVPAVVAEPITKGVYESKFIFYSKVFDDKVRTFCMCPYGEVVSEYNNGVTTVNGHSYANQKTDNTNFALLVSKNFTEPFHDPNAYGHYVARLGNLLAGKVMVQRMQDLLNGRRSTMERLSKSVVKPTLKEATPGDLSLVLPYRHLTSILEMLKALDCVAHGMYSGHTLLYGVEIKSYSSKMAVDNNMETKLKNLYTIGDGAGITRGLMQASVSGLAVAENILNREKHL